MPDEISKPVPVPNCPACFSERVARGRLNPGSATVFYLKETRCRLSAEGPSIELKKSAWICFDCGFLWTRINPATARQKARRFGTPDLQARVLDPNEDLPIPAEAPAVESAHLPRPAEAPEPDPGQLPAPVADPAAPNCRGEPTEP